MDTFAKVLNISECSEEQLIKIHKLTMEYKHESVPVGLFPGWQQGEFTETHRKNMSLAASKRVRTKEHIEKLHAGRKASKNSAEHAAAVISSRIGSKHSEESKEKMSNSRKNNPEVKKLASLAGKVSQLKRKESGYYQTEEYKEKCKLAWEKRRAKKLAKHTGGIC
jgi:hypothetical protein